MIQDTLTKKSSLVQKTKEGSFFLLLLFLVSCSKSCFWKYQEIDTHCPLYRTAILSHHSDNQFSGLNLEFLRGSYGTKGYITVVCGEIPPSPQDISLSQVYIAIDGQAQACLAFRMEGGQKVLLPDPITYLLIDALIGGRKVIVALDGYYAEIPAQDFAKYHKSFESLI